MKTITPLPMWTANGTINASVLNSYVVSDNLNNSAMFYFALYAENSDGTLGQILQQGNITMTGPDYIAYETNQYAWDWVAKTLNVTITGDYVFPTL